MIIGLTGGIGSGKSEVSRRFQQLGITVVDADEIARQVVKPSSVVLKNIVAYFGIHLLNAEGTLNRSLLRDIIFNDPVKKKWLEDLLHPIIRKETIQQLALAAAKSPYVILASPLLLETTQYQLVDRILVVHASEDSQLARASQRDKMNREQIHKIIATQMPSTERCAKADDIINNHGKLADLDDEVKKLHTYYLTLSQPAAKND